MKKETTLIRLFGISAVATLLVMPQATQAAVTSATYGDRHVIQGNFQSGASDVFLASNNNGRRIGAGGTSGNNRVNNPVIEFTLPTLPLGETVITAAEFSLTWDNPAVTSGANFDGIVTLMNYDAVGDFSGADFNDSVGSLGNGSLVGTYTVASVTNGGVLNVSFGAPALSLLQSFYSGVNPTQASAFIRLSMDGTHVYVANVNDRYNIETQLMDSNSPLVTSLSITTIPEPSTALLGAFGVLGLLRRRR